MNNKKFEPRQLTKEEEKKWQTERRLMEKTFLGISGMKIKVKDTDPEAIGFTSQDGDIYLSYRNSLTHNLSPEEASAFRIGVGFHELLHKMNTNFKLTESTVRRLPKYEGILFHQLDNSLEDAAIENFADEVAGGYVLDSLRFAIAKTYELSPRLEEVESDFGQFELALIHFGDMGVLKGHFTSEKAKEVFIKCAPIFYKGVTTKNTYTRNACSKEIFELSRPLWEDLVNQREEFEKMISSLLKMLDDMGVLKNMGSGSGSQNQGDSKDGTNGSGQGSGISISIEIDSDENGGNGGPSLKQQRMAKTLKSIMQESQSGSGQSNKEDSAEDGDNPENGDSENSKDGNNGKEKTDDKDGSKEKDGQNAENGKDVEDEGDNKNNPSENKTNKEGSLDSYNSKADKNEAGKNFGENNNGTIDKDAADGRSDKNRSANQVSESASSLTYTNNSGGNRDDDSLENEIDDEEFELGEDAVESILDALEKAEYELADVEMEDSHGDFDVNVDSPYCKNARVINKNVTLSDVEQAQAAYNKILEQVNPIIKILTNKIKRIISFDAEEVVYKNSGKPNMSRYYGSKVTSRIFNKIKDPSNKSNIAVYAAFDESGSMGGSKIKAERETIIVLAELFANLNIPFYAMGFTADCEGYDAVHNHYIKWKNTAKERAKLININSRSCNFDGYSVRFAGELLKKRKEEHRLLIVLSDGQPNCDKYGYGSAGIADTKNAIREVRKYADVLGVAIGNSDTELLHGMYGKDFIHIGNVEELSVKLPNKIAKIIDEQ